MELINTEWIYVGLQFRVHPEKTPQHSCDGGKTWEDIEFEACPEFCQPILYLYDKDKIT